MKRNESKLVKYTLIAICLIFVFLFLVLPLYIVFAEAFRDGIEKYREAVTDKYTISAVLLTLEATVFAVVVNTVFGVFASWAITKFNFKGKKFLTTLIDLPVTISPIIAGLIFVLTFGRQSILYPALQSMGIKVVFAVPGIILATVFVTFPFISRELIPVLEAEGTDEEEAAALMGASGFTIFRKVTFPAVSVLSDHLRGKTNTLPLHVEILFNEFQYVPAFAVASILVMMAVLILIIRSVIEYKGKKEC